VGKWTADEDSKLHQDAVQTHGDKDWAAISALVPGRTQKRWRSKWRNALDSNIEPTTSRTGKWTADENSKLQDAVQMHGGKDWVAIAALVPGLTQIQCNHRWHHILVSKIDRANERTGKWTAVEDSKLKNAVKMHGGKNWGAIAALVPGRTKYLCYKRWQRVLDPSIDRANGRASKWSKDEDSKLRYSKNAPCPELACNCRTGSWSKEKSVL
jgi:myb proto-oncogene protein